MRVPILRQPHPHLFSVIITIIITIAILVSMKWYLILFFISISLVTKHIEHLVLLVFEDLNILISSIENLIPDFPPVVLGGVIATLWKTVMSSASSGGTTHTRYCVSTLPACHENLFL